MGTWHSRTSASDSMPNPQERVKGWSGVSHQWRWLFSISVTASAWKICERETSKGFLGGEHTRKVAFPERRVTSIPLPIPLSSYCSRAVSFIIKWQWQAEWFLSSVDHYGKLSQGVPGAPEINQIGGPRIGFRVWLRWQSACLVYTRPLAPSWGLGVDEDKGSAASTVDLCVEYMR